MAARLPPSPGARIVVVLMVVALHGAAFFPWAAAPEPQVTTDAIDVAIVPLGESAVDAEATAAAPTAAEKTQPVDQPAPADPPPIVSDPPPQPATETPVADVLPKPPEPSLITLPEQAAPKPQAQDHPKPVERRVAQPRRAARVRSARSDEGRSDKSSAESRRGDPHGDAGATGSARANYAGLVIAEFNRHKRYPDAARRNREQGVASVAFSIDAAGRVATYRITRSSGKAVLDRAVDAIMTAARPPPPPGGSFRGIFVVRFSLDR